MKICFINPHSDPLAIIGEPDSGGQCKVERELMANFTSISRTVSVDSYTRHWGNKPLIENISDRAKVVRVKCAGNDFIPKENLWGCLPEFVDKVMLYCLNNNLNYDIYHAHYADGGKASVLIKEKKDAPLIFTAHSLGKLKQKILPDENKFRYSLRIPAEIEAVEKASKVIALNSIEMENYKKLYNVQSSKIAVIPNGVDVEKYSPSVDRKYLRKKLGWDDKRVIFTTGRIDNRKGFDILAMALNKIMKLNSDKEILCLFPGGGEILSDEESSVIENIKNNLKTAVRNSVFFKRLSDEELVDYYRASDVFVCPSQYEPFGLVIIESFACGTPVIAFNSGGPANIISDDIDGMLATPNSVDSLADRIMDVLFNENKRVEMGKFARKKVVEQYSWRAISLQTLKIYEEVSGASV